MTTFDEMLKGLSDKQVNEDFYKSYPSDVPQSMSFLDYFNPRSYIDPYNSLRNPLKAAPKIDEKVSSQPSPSDAQLTAASPDSSKGSSFNFKMNNLTDYIPGIPNIFGRSTPSYMEGLLGADETKKLQDAANIQGLLGAGLSLAQGMSKIGPRRSAVQNILGALAGGFGAAGGAYDQGIKNYMTKQQIEQAKLAQQDALIKRQQSLVQQNAIETLIASPQIAGDPVKVAYLRANPNEALKLYSELLPIQEAAQTLGQPTAPSAPAVTTQQAPTAPAQQMQLEAAPAVTAKGSTFFGVPNFAAGEKYVDENRNIQAQQQPTVSAAEITQQDKVLPEVLVQPKASAYNARLAEKQQIEKIINTYSDPKLAGNERASKIVDQNLKRLEAINKELTKASVSDISGDLGTFRNSAPEPFRNQIDNLINIASTGEITPDQLAQRTADINKQINEYNQKDLDYKRAQTNYQNEVYRVAQKVAPGVAPENYTPQQIAAIDNQVQKEKKDLANAGRSLTTVNVGEKKFAESFGAGVSGAVQKTYENAVAAQNTLNTIQNIQPLIKEGVYSGPLSTSNIYIDRLASSLGILSGSKEEKLARTSQAMQGLASLELEAAKSMAGQGAITDFERGLIARASAGNFAQFTANEVSGLMKALEKISNRKIEAHNKNLERLSRRPDTSGLVDFYRLEETNNLQNSIQEELNKRKGAK